MLVVASKKYLFALLSLILAVLVYFLLPSDCPEPAKRMIFIFIVAAFFWALEIIPLMATSLLVVLLECLLLTGLLGNAANIASFGAFLAPLANPVIILFLGGFTLALAFQKYGIDYWLVTRLFRIFGQKPFFVLGGFMSVTALIGMWISNTASTALMLGMIFPLLGQLEKDDPFRKALVLAIPFGARIGGITTIVGTPTNAIAVGLLAEQGIRVHFLTWTMMTFPLAILLVAVTTFILYWLFPPKSRGINTLLKEAKPFDQRSKLVAAICLLTVCLWFTSIWHRIPESIVALICVVILTAFGLIDTTDIKKLDWDILILMWGGLALGEGMEKSGLATWFTRLPIFPEQVWLLDILVCVVTVFLSTFMSNTATVNLLIPITFSLPTENPIFLAAIVALSASFDLGLPISTPPMAMAYGTKEISIGEMLKTGTLFAIIANVLLLLGVRLMMSKVFIS